MILVKEFSEGAGGGVLGPTDIGKALGTDALGVLGQFVDFFSAQDRGGVLCHKRTNRPAELQSRREHGHGKLSDRFGNILNFHAEAGIGLVGAVKIHGIRVGHALHGQSDLKAENLFEYSLYEALIHGHNVLLGGKGHF